MSKYEVVAIRWNSERGEQEKYVAGSFDKYILAKLFADAYAEHYKANPEIVEYVKK